MVNLELGNLLATSSLLATYLVAVGASQATTSSTQQQPANTNYYYLPQTAQPVSGVRVENISNNLQKQAQLLALNDIKTNDDEDEDDDDQVQESSLSNLNSSSAINYHNLTTISEEDELKLLNFPAKREDLSTAIPLTVIFGLLLLTGCIGNLCTAIVIARPKNKYMHTATNYYLFSLAMSDFLFLILGLPQEMYTIWRRYPYAFGESFCMIRGYLSEASTYASILTISAFTVERYVAICHPLWAHTMSQLPRAITSILIIWLLAAVCAIPPAAELGVDFQKGPLTNRTLLESAQCVTKRTIYENMFVISAIVFFIVPMIIVTILYILIALELRRSSKMNNAITSQSTQHHQLIHQHNQVAAHHHHHHHHLCPAGAAGRGSRSQQQLSSNAFSVSPSGGDHSCSSPSSAQPPGNSGNHLPASEQSKTHSKLDRLDRSLMDNILSQRPSSAIGTSEHFERAAPFKLLSSYKWPAALFSSNQQHDEKALCSCCLCPHHHPPNLHNHSGHLEVVGNKKPAIHLTRSHQFEQEGTTGTSLLLVSNHASGESPETGCKNHSPLSYHESLIGRQSASSAVRPPPSPNASHPNRKHPHLQQHQFSLQVNSAGSPSRASIQAAQHSNGKLHRHCSCQNSQHQHQQHHHHHHHHHTSSHKRSAAASSKKSVVRMLVAVVVSFFICWVPFHAQRLLASYLAREREVDSKNQFLLDVYLKLTYISGIMYYLSSTINPLLYQLMSAKFRLAFKETFKCSLFKCAIFSSSSERRASGCGSPSNSLKYPPALDSQHPAHLSAGSQKHLHCPSLSCYSPTCGQAAPAADCSAICLANSDYSTAEHFLLGHPQQQQQRNSQEQVGGRKKRKFARLFARMAGYVGPVKRFLGLRSAARRAGFVETQNCSAELLDCAQCSPPECRAIRSCSPECSRSSPKCAASPLLRTPTTLKLARAVPRESQTPQSPLLSRMTGGGHAHQGVSGPERAELERLVKPASVGDNLSCDGLNDELTAMPPSSPESGNLSGTSPPSELRREGVVGPATEKDRSSRRLRGKLLLDGLAPISGRRQSLQHQVALQQVANQQIAQGQRCQTHLSDALEPSSGSGKRTEGGEQIAPSAGPILDEDVRRKSSCSSSVANNRNNLHTLSSSLSSYSDRQLDKKLSLSTTTSAIDDCSMSYTNNSQFTAASSNQALRALDDEHTHHSADSASASASSSSSANAIETEIAAAGEGNSTM